METHREKQTGKIREAPVLCYSFSCGDITVQFPRGLSRERRAEGGGKKNRKVEAMREVAVALRNFFCGLLNLSGILQQRSEF